MAFGLRDIGAVQEDQATRPISPTQLVWPMTLATLKGDSLRGRTSKALTLNYKLAINSFATQ